MDSEMRIIVAVCVLAAGLLATSTAFAQDESAAEPSSRQVALNARAVEAIENGQYSLAINRLEESLELGPLNITYLNLGRAYQLMGRCAQAIEAYEKVEGAPHVPRPEHRVILAKTSTYLDETRTTCTQGSTQQEGAGSGKGGVKIVVREQSANLQPWAWAATSAGAALVLTSVGLHLGARSIRSDLEVAQRNEDGQVTGVTQDEAYRRTDRANTFDTIALSAGIVGGVFTVVGTYLFVTDASQEADTRMSVGRMHNGVGVVFIQSF